MSTQVKKNWGNALSAFADKRAAIMFFLGFSAGIPILLIFSSLSLWLGAAGVDKTAVTMFSWAALGYSFKFVWAPLVDALPIPVLTKMLGRRRSWLLLAQVLIMVAIGVMAMTNPALGQQALIQMAIGAVLLGFASATQDIVIDAYRTDILAPNERGLGGSLAILGYRLATIISGGIALIWAQNSGWSHVYTLMAGIMAAAAVISFLLLPPVSATLKPLDSDPKQELAGFMAMLLGFVIGWFAMHYLLILLGFDPDSPNKWLQLGFIVAQLSAALPLGYKLARWVGFETLNRSLDSYFAQPSAVAFLVLIVLYKLGDAFAGSLTTPFLIKGMGFSQAEVGIVIKVIGAWITIFGVIIAGFIMLRLSLFKALLIFGLLQLISNLGFWLLAVEGKNAWGSFLLPAFDIGIMAVKEASQIDYLLMLVIAFENISGGMGTAAFTVLLMSLCNQRFTATHYALLSAFAALGRIYVSPLSGVLSESWGWPNFFIFSVIMAIPGLFAVWVMRPNLLGLQKANP